MNRRLQQFLDAENINQSQLADSLGVARASVSHILAGRNKPGFDFIESISRNFPTLNLEWLITGKGRMYYDFNNLTNRKEAVSGSSSVAEPGLLFNDIDTSDRESVPAYKPDNVGKSPDEHKVNTLVTNAKSTEHKRVITKVVVFFDDNTFQELK